MVAGVCAWYGALRRGVPRAAGLAVAAVALAVAVVVLATGGTRFADLLVLAGLLVTLAASRATLGVHVDLPGAAPPAAAGAVLQPEVGRR